MTTRGLTSGFQGNRSGLNSDALESSVLMNNFYHQHLYLKANSETERQEWVAALGSAKVQKSKILGAASNGDLLNPDRNPGLTGLDQSTRLGSPLCNAALLKTKRSELRLYCDMLMQQVHAVKDAAGRIPNPGADSENPALAESIIEVCPTKLSLVINADDNTRLLLVAE